MKYLLQIILLIIFTLNLVYCWNNNQKVLIKEVEVLVYNDRTVPYDSIFNKIAFIESNNNPNVIGDNGTSFGIVQIQKSVIKDVNYYWGTSFKHSEAFSKERSKRIFKLYLLSLIERQGIRTEEQIVRCWNGGPEGFKKSSTDKYWEKYQGI